MAAYSASCPEEATVVNPAEGIVQINCPNEDIDCSSIPDQVIRVFTITPMFTWYLTEQAPKSISGSIRAKVGGCYLQPMDATWNQNFQEGWGGPLESCNYTAAGCTSANRLAMTVGVAYPVEWTSTDVYPDTTANQLFAVLLGH
jgi:hypothetical protein